MDLTLDNSRNVCFQLFSPKGRVGRYVCRIPVGDITAEGNAIIVTRELANRLDAAFDFVRQGESVCAYIVADNVTADTDPIDVPDCKIVNLLSYDKFVGRYVDWRHAYNLFAYQFDPRNGLTIKADGGPAAEVEA